MIGFEEASLRLAVAAAFCFTVTFAAPARAAGVAVSIQSTGEVGPEVAERLVSELSIEGYAVEARALDEPTPCDPNGAKGMSVGAEARAWIRLSTDPAAGDTVVATICYLGALPFLQQASSSAPRGDPRKLAVATAEALNGLRSKVPSPAPESTPRPVEAPPPHAPVPHQITSKRAALENSVTFGGAVVLNAPDFPVVPAVTAAGNLGVTSSVALLIDALCPVGGAEVASPGVVATVRTAWIRIGPRMHLAAGDFELSGALLAGPALTWATAVAEPPLAGGADVTPGAVVSFKALVEYPRHGSIFGQASASGSALMPGVKVKLGSDASKPLGAWPLEASVGLGVRWGGGS